MLPCMLTGNRYKTATAYTACGYFYSCGARIAKYDKAANVIYLLKGKFSLTTNCQRKAIREFAEANGIAIVEKENIYSV